MQTQLNIDATLHVPDRQRGVPQKTGLGAGILCPQMEIVRAIVLYGVLDEIGFLRLLCSVQPILHLSENLAFCLRPFLPSLNCLFLCCLTFFRPAVAVCLVGKDLFHTDNNAFVFVLEKLSRRWRPYLASLQSILRRSGTHRPRLPRPEKPIWCGTE